MSFSTQVKEEMLKSMATARHCMLAEIAGYLNNIGFVEEEKIFFSTEHENVSQRIEILLKKTYGIAVKPVAEENGSRVRFFINILNKTDVDNILMSIKYEKGSASVDGRLLQQSCCKRAYLQAVFMSIGSITDPDKGYHLEFVSSYEERLNQIKKLIETFDINAKMTIRKNQYVLYIKEGQSIVDLLNVMGAHVALMNMENTIIMKDFRNGLNRKVNCEAANLIKTANAGSRQKADIELIRDRYGLEKLPDNLREIAILRLENPESSLNELSEMIQNKISKSGINHRLRKLSELADELR